MKREPRLKYHRPWPARSPGRIRVMDAIPAHSVSFKVQLPSVGAGKKPKARAGQTIPGARRHGPAP